MIFNELTTIEGLTTEINRRIFILVQEVHSKLKKSDRARHYLLKKKKKKSKAKNLELHTYSTMFSLISHSISVGIIHYGYSPHYFI